jgi:hypothetical protein
MVVVVAVLLKIQEQELLVDQVVEDKVVLEQIMPVQALQIPVAVVVAVVITLHLKPEGQVDQVS